MWCPSTADAKNNDLTIERTMMISRNNGYGGIYVYNTETITNIPEIPTDTLVLAWGNKLQRNFEYNLIHKLSKKITNLLCFVHNKNGSPGLPTRLPKNTIIKKFK